MLLNKVSLNGDWLLVWDRSGQEVMPVTMAEAEGCALPRARGQVPGNFELDLERAGVLPEIFYGKNVLLTQEYELANVFYGRRFAYEAEVTGREELVLEGVDTFADFYLNGERVGSTDNALITHRLPLRGLRQGENELTCVLRSCLREAEAGPIRAGENALAYNYSSLRARKAPSAYGWDIMPRTVSCGLWRDVSIQLAPQRRIAQCYVSTTEVTEQGAELDLFYELILPTEQLSGCTLTLQADCGEDTFTQVLHPFWRGGHHKFTVKAPRLWWPRGYGEPALYDCRLTLTRGEELLDEQRFTLGIRTVQLVRTGVTDEKGSGDFCFIINNRRVFLLGSNWVPADAFHSRDRERIPAIVEMAWDAGCNCLRCWGGNVYEDDVFFDLCDRRGIVIWQDFAMACGVYPQDGEFAAALEREAVSVVRALRQHPSLILWSGDNECDAAVFWSGPLRLPNDNILTRKVLPSVVFAEDPARPFLPSSPYIDEDAQKNGRQDLSEEHLWGPRDYYKSEFYLTSTAHFVSEIGYHGCPHPASLRRFLPEEALWPWQGNEDWLVHAACHRLTEDDPYRYRIALMATQAALLVGEEAIGDLEDFALASQLSQAEAMKFFIERFRSQRGRRTGMIWWNIMDGWPQFSDAVVDYYGARKLAFHSIAAASRPLQLMVDEGGQLLALNDTPREEALRFTVRELFAGETVLCGQGTARADGVTVLGVLPMEGQGLYHITFTHEGGEGSNHYLMGKPPFSLEKLKAALPTLFPRFRLEV